MGKREKEETNSFGSGGILKMKTTTKKVKKVENLIYSKFRGNRATMYGIEMKAVPRNEYIQYQQNNGHPELKTERVGWFSCICA